MGWNVAYFLHLFYRISVNSGGTVWSVCQRECCIERDLHEESSPNGRQQYLEVNPIQQH